MTAREMEIAYAKAFCADAQRTLLMLKLQYERAAWLYNNSECDELHQFEKIAEAYMCINEYKECLHTYLCESGAEHKEENEESEDYN